MPCPISSDGCQERWQQLAAQVVMEQDPAMFAKLVHELNDMLEAKQDSINKLRNEQRELPFGH